MAADKKLDLKTALQALKVSRSALTKANSEFDWACQELDKHIYTAKTKKIRLAATLMDCLETLIMRSKKRIDAKDVTLETIIGLCEDEVESTSTSCDWNNS